MADSLAVTNWPENGSRERVALDLMGRIREAQGPNAARDEAEILALYARCRRAVFNHPAN